MKSLVAKIRDDISADVGDAISLNDQQSRKRHQFYYNRMLFSKFPPAMQLFDVYEIKEQVELSALKG